MLRRIANQPAALRNTVPLPPYAGAISRHWPCPFPGVGGQCGRDGAMSGRDRGRGIAASPSLMARCWSTDRTLVWQVGAMHGMHCARCTVAMGHCRVWKYLLLMRDVVDIFFIESVRQEFLLCSSSVFLFLRLFLWILLHSR